MANGEWRVRSGTHYQRNGMGIIGGRRGLCGVLGKFWCSGKALPW